jgi:UDP-3-O-[3-hydroxymyristoyl] glucosamine N-acyltransferase
MHKLSDFFSSGVIKDGHFEQTQFSNTNMPNSVCFAARKEFVLQANANESISCVLTTKEIASTITEQKGLVVLDQPEKQFYKLHNKLFLEYEMHPDMDFEIHPTADIHQSAIVNDRCHIGENTTIGAGAIVEQYSYICENVNIGPRAIIGASGHFYKKYNNKLFKVEHSGGVKVNSGAQILAGAVISKDLHKGFTIIGEDSIISINVHVGHGCKIGSKCIIAGNAQISGFCSFGDEVWIGPSATISNLVNIGNRARVEIGSIVVRNIKPGEIVSGNFAYSHIKNLRDFATKDK